MKIRVDEKLCTKCGLCVKYCSFGAIEYEDGVPVFNASCVLCGACVKPCPVGAIAIDRKVLERDLSEYSGVMAFIETSGDEVKNVGIEMLSAARKLADKVGEKCSAVVLGVRGEKVRGVLSEYGADTVIAVEHERLANYSTELYTNVMVGVLSKYKPSIVLFGATHLGRDLAPRIAGRIDTGLTADCTGLDIDGDGNLLQTRPTFGGNILATILTPHHRPQMATVRSNVMKRDKCERSARTRLETLAVEVDDAKQRVRLLKEEKVSSPYSNVEEADYIVSGGKGMGKAENFKMLERLVSTLAEAVGTARVALGASRSAVDAGWIPHQHQVGQTGKAVTPKLYVACGISGQIQHVMGMRESEKIIAVNKDRNAPIFRMADLGIIGDVTEVIPLLTKHLEENMAKLKRGEQSPLESIKKAKGKSAGSSRSP